MTKNPTIKRNSKYITAYRITSNICPPFVLLVNEKNYHAQRTDN